MAAQGDQVVRGHQRRHQRGIFIHYPGASQTLTRFRGLVIKKGRPFVSASVQTVMYACAAESAKPGRASTLEQAGRPAAVLDVRAPSALAVPR